VRLDRNSRSAISRLPSPSATSAAISRSRLVSCLIVIAGGTLSAAAASPRATAIAPPSGRTIPRWHSASNRSSPSSFRAVCAAPPRISAYAGPMSTGALMIFHRVSLAPYSTAARS